MSHYVWAICNRDKTRFMNGSNSNAAHDAKDVNAMVPLQFASLLYTPAACAPGLTRAIKTVNINRDHANLPPLNAGDLQIIKIELKIA